MRLTRLPLFLARVLIFYPASAAIAEDLVGDYAIIADPINSEAGHLSVEGSLDVMGGISLGGAGYPGVLLMHSGNQTLFQAQEEISNFRWNELGTGSNPSKEKMLLSSSNSLTLYKLGTTPSAGIVLNPNTGALTLAGISSGIYNSSGNPVMQIGSTGTASFPGPVAFTQGVQVNGGLTSNGQIVSDQDGYLNSLTVGRGGGNLITNAVLGSGAFVSNTLGQHNVAIGHRALESNTSAYLNVAMGSYALMNNISGEQNVAVGTQALVANISGRDNIAMGLAALYLNTSGSSNVGIGVVSLRSNTTGSYNIAFGAETLFSNNGNYNTVTGFRAMYSNTTGSENTAMGSHALSRNSVGGQNAVLGWAAGQYNEVGLRNVMVGWDAASYDASGVGLQNAQNSVYIGASVRGHSNSDNNAIVIGSNAVGEGANTTVIGNTSTTLARIHGTVNASGVKTGNLEIEQPDEMQDALSVGGRTRFNGEVIISQPQGDISMGIYE